MKQVLSTLVAVICVSTLATQNVMAMPKCNKQNCCVVNNKGGGCELVHRDNDRRCEARGLPNLCWSVVNCCNY